MPGSPTKTVDRSQEQLSQSDQSSIQLLLKARAGDQSAIDRLFKRQMPDLWRWAHGRLPRWARSLMDTGDLVQETLLRGFRALDRVEPRGRGALQAYLRGAVMNRLRDEIRKTNRTPFSRELTGEEPTPSPSPFEQFAEKQKAERYERALATLRPAEREAIVARLEMRFSYDQIALTLDKASPDAARMAVKRALLRLAEEMERAG